MGGFQQKSYNRGGARLSLLIKNAHDALTPAKLSDLSKGDNRTGTIYSLPDGRMEAVAEGDEEALQGLLEHVRETAGTGFEVREAWQLPVGSYRTDFPIVAMQPKMQATISLKGDDQTLSYISRHVKIEAVFNRGLALVDKTLLNPSELQLTVKGDFKRLKSFVRWCNDGPPMARADEVTVEWSSE